jgi:hypothetical protein
MAAERDLWRAVMRRAIEDLFLDGTEREKVAARREAHEWFRRAGRDFEFVCQMNGLEPEAVQDAYLGGMMDKGMFLTKVRECN